MSEQSGGRWIREMPARPGTYWTRTHDGMDAGLRSVCADPRNGSLYDPRAIALGGCEWGGWWYSEPIPEIPEWKR